MKLEQLIYILGKLGELRRFDFGLFHNMTSIYDWHCTIVIEHPIGQTQKFYYLDVIDSTIEATIENVICKLELSFPIHMKNFLEQIKKIKENKNV